MEKEQTIIYFEDGIYGFEEIKEYVLLKEDAEGTLWSLQAAHSDVPSFIVLNPFLFVKDYCPQLSEADLRYFGRPQADELCFLSVVVLKENPADSVMNLKSPIVIHTGTRKGRQIILENTDYPIRYKPFAQTSKEGN